MGKFIVNHRKAIIVISFLLLIPSVLGIMNTRINYDMLTYLPEDMETVKGQDILMDEFGKGGFSIVVVEDKTTKEVEQIKNDISNVDTVENVLNINDVLNPDIPREILPIEISSNLGNEDASMIVVFFENATSDDETLKAIEEIREVTDKNSYVSGLSALVTDLKTISEREEPIYVVIAVALACATMMILLDSYLAPIIFLVSIGIAIIMNMGTNYFLGEISYITKALAAVLQLAVTMDYSIFLWHSYEDNSSLVKDKKVAMANAIDATLVSVSGSSITTIAGFLALCFMSYTMGSDLGIVMAKGVLLGVISSVTILPSLLLVLDKKISKASHRTLIPKMDKLASGVTKRKSIYVIIFIILLGPAYYGYSNSSLVYDFTNIISEEEASAESIEGVKFIEANEKLRENFDIGSSYMIIADKELLPLDGSAMSNELGKVEGINNVIGIDHLVGSNIPRAILPEEIKDEFIGDEHQIILLNSEYRVSTDECNNQIDEVNNISKKYDINSMLIGEAPCTKNLIEITDKDFKVVSFISILAVFIIVGLVLKSLVLPIILVAIIELAIFINLGIPYFTGLELPFIVPICISTIQLGATVDYAILLTTKYKKGRKEGVMKHDAVENAVKTSANSIMVSALGFFVATYGVGVYSDISIISTFCNLMARGALISMIMVIVILPSMLLVFDKVIIATTVDLRINKNHFKGGKKNEVLQ